MKISSPQIFKSLIFKCFPFKLANVYWTHSDSTLLGTAAAVQDLCDKLFVPGTHYLAILAIHKRQS